MPPVGRFADAAKQRLIQKRKELDARATGVELPPKPEPEPKPESNLAAGVEKYLSQMMSFVGNDGYGRTKKSVNAYRNRLSFYLRFCAEKRVTDLRLGDYDHLMEYVGWLRRQTKRNGKMVSDRYVFNIFATLGTFALSLDITVPAKKILLKLGDKKKEVKAHTEKSCCTNSSSGRWGVNRKWHTLRLAIWTSATTPSTCAPSRIATTV